MAGGPEFARIEAWGPDSLRVPGARPRRVGPGPRRACRPPPRQRCGQDQRGCGGHRGGGADRRGRCCRPHMLRARSGRARATGEKPIHYWWPGARNSPLRVTATSSWSNASPPTTGSGSSGWASTPTGAWTKRASSSTSYNATPRSASLSWCRAAATGSCGTTRPWAGSSWGHGHPLGRRQRPTDRLLGHRRLSRPRSWAGTPTSPAMRPCCPAWAAGFWQSKLRYRTQDELLEVAREYHRRGLPLSVIVVDFFHWTQLGDWRFEPSEWPDPRAMVEELSAMGVHLMVSVWPSVSVMSSNYRPMLEAGYLISSERGLGGHADWPDRHAPVRLPVCLL